MNENQKIIEMAIKLGYLHGEEAISACNQYKIVYQKNPRVEFLHFLIHHRYINSDEAKIIWEKCKIISRRRPIQKDNSSIRNTKKSLPQKNSNDLPIGKIEPGMVWQNFEILEVIGRGGMGIVYKARQISPNRIVALKVLVSSKIPAKQRQRFLKEAQIGARLAHPNIVTTYLASMDKKSAFIAMQYIEGCSLDVYCKKFTPSLEKKLRLLSQIALALDYAHKQKVIHRDIKPQNILISEDGIPYLTDFGISRSFRIEDQSLTSTGEVLGTPRYMPPEQAKGRKKTSRFSRGYLFTWSCSLYYCDFSSNDRGGKRL